jgi:hypothetical protein
LDGDAHEIQEAMRDGCCDISRYGGVLLTLDTGAKFLAGRCVWAAKFSQPLVPSWVMDARASYFAVHPSAMSHEGSFHCGIWCARDVDMSISDRVYGKRILIVGGGMMAATLALSACRRGAKSVTLLVRRRIDVSEFECDVKYFGSKGLRDYHACTDMNVRAKMLESYTTKASINEHTHRQLLEEQMGEGRLTILEQRILKSVTWDELHESWHVAITPSSAAKAEFESELFRRFREDGVKVEPNAVSDFEKKKVSNHDELWLACGEVVNISNDPALGALISKQSEIAQGLPVLVEEDFGDYSKSQSIIAAARGGCRLPGTSMYFIGAYCALSLGPGSDLPVGHRLAAKQIAMAMKKHQTMILRQQDPYKLQIEESPHTESNTINSHACLTRYKKLAEEYHGKGIIDTSDLFPSDMSRVELQKFELYEEDMTMDIRVSIPEPIESQHVYVCFQNEALEMWAVGEKHAYRFFVRKLYKPVIVERCSYKVFTKKQRVTLKIHKFNNLYWRFLKG